MKLRPFLLCSILSLLGWCCPQSAAQTYTVPQTVTATLASGLACTGSPQTFITGGPNKLFQNLGQTQHYLTVSFSAATTFEAEIDGIDPSGNVFLISDQIIGVPTSKPLTVTGSGYFSKIQVSITCAPTSAFFSAAYTGTSSTSNLNVGSYFLSQIDKHSFGAVAANVTTAVSWQPPYGNTSGTIFMSYAGAAGPAGSTLTVSCLTNAGSVTEQTFTPVTTVSIVQQFVVNPAPCVSTTLTYTSGGASTALLNLDYIYNFPGISPFTGGGPSTNVNIAEVGGTPVTSPLPVDCVTGCSGSSASVGVVQPATTFNSESTSATATAVTKSIAASGVTRVFLYGVTVRCSAGSASVTVKDGVAGTVIWSSNSTFASTSTSSIAWTSAPLASSSGNGMDIVLGSCGAGQTGTLDVQASQL
jgi:hypothetical protein